MELEAEIWGYSIWTTIYKSALFRIWEWICIYWETEIKAASSGVDYGTKLETQIGITNLIAISQNYNNSKKIIYLLFIYLSIAISLWFNYQGWCKFSLENYLKAILIEFLYH
ncbi:unnamed protein product [Blepharisma stoltei]|uniref:Uncharacterized protein n=1 Tax=Blepharisma stoltei TaxID=1481888 RepID=A0AAU9JGN8_9CILI|nr:unnamed protein product [Blepharisma stoltei]